MADTMDISEDRLNKLTDDLLHKESSNDACRVFLVMSEKKLFLSDVVYERICNIIINDHEQSAKENAIRTIDLLIHNGRKASDSCLNALSIALQDEKSVKLRTYASKILYTIIQQESDVHLNCSLMNVISNALHDTSVSVQSYTLNLFEQLMRNRPTDISQQVIDSMELFLSNIYRDINKNYVKCGLITSFFLNLLYRPYKINEKLLNIFSEFLIIEVIEHKDMLLNISASYVLQRAIENHLIDGNLSLEVLANISTCFNSKSCENKQLLEYCLRILCSLNDDQLGSAQLNGNLLKNYLKDTNFNEKLRSYLVILLGNLCKISYKYIDDENNNSIIQDTIDILIEGIDHEKLLHSSIYTLRNIAQYQQDYLSIFPLPKFVLILNQENLNKEIRQNACLILDFAIQNQQILTKYEIDGLENALNDSDSVLSMTALIAFQHLFENYYKNTDLIESYVKKICTFSIESLLNSNEIFNLNASKLLEIIIKYHLKHEFTDDEIRNLCLGLQTNINPLICQSIFNSLKQINSPVSFNIHHLIDLEEITEHFNKSNCDEFEKKLNEFINDTNFQNKNLSINVLKLIEKLIETNSYSLNLILILLQSIQNGQKISIDFIEIIIKQLNMNKHTERLNILIEIIYYIIVQNGQSLTENSIQQFQEYFLHNQFSSKNTIEILKLLINRNHIQMNTNIYKKIINLLENQLDNDIQIILMETLAYSLQNLSSNIDLPIEQILKLIENYFQSNHSTEQIKYYSCLALNALVTHQIILSNSTLDLLKIYAQDDNQSMTINLREISLNILKEYVQINKQSENIIQMNEIEEILNEEIIEQKILDHRNLTHRLEAGKQLLSIVENGKQSLSKSQMKILELSLNFSDSSIEYKLIVLKIFKYVSTNLNSSQIQCILDLINDNSLTEIVIEILKSLIDIKKSFPIETLNPLINFVFEHSNRILRNSVIDCLERIIGYETISIDLFNRIQLEILSKDLRNPTKDIQKKKIAIDKCLKLVRDEYRLSINTIESLEYLLNNSFNMKDIQEQIFDIIELSIRNGQKFPPTFLTYLSQLMKDTQFNQTRIIQIMNLLSMDTQQLISQDIFDNFAENLLENSNESIEILLKGTQNGCQLTQKMINHLEEMLQNPDQCLKAMKILKNQAKNKLILEENLVQCLENLIEKNDQIICQSILNILKYLPTYQPSEKFITDLQNFLEKHPLYIKIGVILNKIINFPLQVKLHFIQIFLTVEYIESDIHDNPLKFICRQLLCTDLLTRIHQNDKYEKLDQFEFYANLNNLEEFFSFQPYSIDRDEILLFFIENASKFTLKNLNDILLLLKTDSEALKILLISSSNDCIKNLQIHWLYSMIDRYSYIRLNENILLNDDQAEEIVDLLRRKLEFSIPLSECFLQRIHHIEDFNQLIEFLNYLTEKNLSKQINLSNYFTHIDAQKIIAKDLYSWTFDIQSDLINKKILDLCQSRQFNEPKILQNLQSIILSICINDWSFEVFGRFIEILKNKQMETFELMIKNFFDSLTIINNFGISNKHENTIESIFNSKKNQDWPLEVHRFAVSVSFDRDEHEKNLKDLLDEIKKSNDEENGQQLSPSIDILEEKYREIISAYSYDSELYSIGKPINNWNEDDVRKWSTYYRANQNKTSEKTKSEVICVVKRAIFLHNTKQKFEPRTIQILSLLLMLDASNRNIARLAQIKTGEGKSVIISMFAAIKALDGHKVDIVTTSPLLAKRDADNKKNFYEMLNLTVGENSGTSTIKSCYKNDIVYGNINEFQFDVLKDEYSLLGTRCQRQFDIAIVDEVDSMLIDENSKVCRLSSKIPAIDELKIILTVIWQELNRTFERIVRMENKLYCITVPFRTDENGQIIFLKSAEADENGKIIEPSTATTDDDEENFIEIEDAYTFIENHIKNYLENKLLKPNENNECLLNIPKHLTEFVKQQLTKWIFNAWQAKFAYRENIDYLITDSSDGRKSIVPIDYRNTGIIQTNTSWPDGLHQFLQIKHKLRISAESLTTNFLSNIAFFSRYGKNLFGLTGTLGTQEAKDLIHYIYNVDFVIIPSYKYTQFVSYPDRLCQLKDDWLNECIQSIYTEAKITQRAVLVICETKFDASTISEKLIEKDSQLKKSIKLYTRSDNEEQNAIENELDCEQIIVATNLAGRGTDIGTTHKVEENGGLHVLVTFLPLNTRVEHQAFGRTSRQGKRGTAQLIVLPSTDNESTYDNIEQLKQDRDLREKQYINRAKFIELKNIERRDRLFRKFCILRHKLRQQEDDTYKLDSVEELWGLWLKTTFAKEDSKNETTNDLTDELLEKKFEEFSSKISNDYSSNAIFQNPFYLILKASEYIFKKKQYDQAINFLRDAIKADSIFTASARYNLAYALMKQSTKNKTEAKSELTEAFKTIENILIPQQQTMLISFDINQNITTTDDNTKIKGDAEDQIMNRINLLYLCRSQIEQGTSVIEDAENKKHDVRMEYKPLDEFFSDTNKPTLDINEFKETGFIGFFHLTEKEPTPWLSIITVGLLGIAQAAAGAALIAFTGGAAINIGSMLLSEGINDMIFAIKCAVTGEFSWTEYGIQKAISLAITIATCGMGALKEAGQAIKSGFKGCASMIKAAIVGGTQLMGQFTKEGWKLVGKQIGQAFLKAGAKEILKTVLDKTLLAELSKSINKQISANIEQKVNNEINSNQTINEFLAIDAALQRPNTHHQEIERLVIRILHPQSNRFADAAIAIAKGILNRLTNGFSGHTIQIITAGKCLLELMTFLENFFIEFKHDLDKLKDQLKIDYLLHVNKSDVVDKRTAKEITESLKKEQYVAHDNIKVIKPIEPTVFKLDKHQNHETYVINVCNNIYTETTKRSEYGFEKNMITKTLTDQLANYMTNRLNAELINPAVHAGVDAAVNKLSNKIERACADSRGTLEEQLGKRRAQNTIIQHGKDLGKRTDKQQTKDTSIHPDVENLARNVENDAPGDLKDIIALNAKLGCPIQIFRNGNYDMTIGDTNSGEPLKLDFGEGQNGDIGHYTGTDNIIPTGAKNCLFDTLSAQTKIPANELRQMAADGIRENPDSYLKMMSSIYFLGENPNKNLLYVGGAHKMIPMTEDDLPESESQENESSDFQRHHLREILSNPSDLHIIYPMDENNPVEKAIVREIDTDSQGKPVYRTEYIEANLMPSHYRHNKRENFPQSGHTSTKHMKENLNAGKDDERGHLIPNSSSGPPEFYNLTPQHKGVNRNVGVEHQTESWVKTEFEEREHLKNAKGSIKVKMRLTYEDYKTGRPDGFVKKTKYNHASDASGSGKTDVRISTIPNDTSLATPRSGNATRKKRPPS